MARKYDTEQLKLDLALSIRSFCLYFLPNGKYVGGEYTVGSLGGEPGKSLKICLADGKIGMWKDFATGESGNNLLDLLCKMRGGDFGAACEEAANWLNVPERYGIKPQGFLRQLNGESSPTLLPPSHLRPRQNPSRLKHHNFCDLTTGITHDRVTLARLLGVNGKSLDHAVRDVQPVRRFFARCSEISTPHLAQQVQQIVST
ncbi:MAG: hypothetical protein LBB16_02235, partial [Puniceicoccales bacterium]|nr:hypothetical protein [Puniceicoccales bacterium]